MKTVAEREGEIKRAANNWKEVFWLKGRIPDIIRAIRRETVEECVTAAANKWLEEDHEDRYLSDISAAILKVSEEE